MYILQYINLNFQKLFLEVNIVVLVTTILVLVIFGLTKTTFVLLYIFLSISKLLWFFIQSTDKLFVQMSGIYAYY